MTSKRSSTSKIAAHSSVEPRAIAVASSLLVHVLDKTGPVIDKAVDAGANQVSGPSFSRSNIDGIYRQALQKAYAQARAKAQALAARAGVRLGRPTTISEGTSSTPIPFAAAAGAATRAPTPVETGQIEVDATVSVSFAIG